MPEVWSGPAVRSLRKSRYKAYGLDTECRACIATRNRDTRGPGTRTAASADATFGDPDGDRPCGIQAIRVLLSPTDVVSKQDPPTTSFRPTTARLFE